MGSLNARHAFDPLDLEIIDKVYEVACAHIEARNLCEPQKCAEEEDYVRQWVFVLAGVGSFDFDSLCDKVLENMVALQVMSEPPEKPELRIARINGPAQREHSCDPPIILPSLAPSPLRLPKHVS